MAFLKEYLPPSLAPADVFFWGTPLEFFLVLPLRILQTRLAFGP